MECKNKKRVSVKVEVKPITVLQSFANWMAITAGERDEKFQVTQSETAIVIVRANKQSNG